MVDRNGDLLSTRRRLDTKNNKTIHPKNQFFPIFATTPPTASSRHFSCDLLSKSVLSHICNNELEFLMKKRFVVICFQNQFFPIFATTKDALGIKTHSLWFAFKISSFPYLQQRRSEKLTLDKGCDLLSKSVLSHICNN